MAAASCGGGRADDLSQPNPPGATACTTDADCRGATPVCDQLAHQCVQCLFDTQCGADAQCNGKLCVAVTACNSSLDCVHVPAATICDPVKRTCVQCVAPTDCTGTADCIQNHCVPYDPCKTSLDCPAGKVCASLLGRCVECETDLDCPDGNLCAANTCNELVACVSDNQCTPLGKLCDKSLGYCVDCLTNEQCPDVYH